MLRNIKRLLYLVVGSIILLLAIWALLDQAVLDLECTQHAQFDRSETILLDSVFGFSIEGILFIYGIYYFYKVIRFLRCGVSEITISYYSQRYMRIFYIIAGLLFINPQFDSVSASIFDAFMSERSVQLIKIILFLLSIIFQIFLIEYSQRHHLSIKLEFFLFHYSFLFFAILTLSCNNLVVMLLLFEGMFFCLIFFFTGLFLPGMRYDITGTYIGNSTIQSYIDFLFRQKERYAVETTPIFGIFVYFIYNAFSVGLLLLAYSYFICFSQDLQLLNFFTFSINDIFESSQMHEIYSLKFFIFIFLLFFIFKIGLFPFHNWIIRVFLSLNYCSLFFLLILFKLVVFSVLIRITHTYLFNIIPYLQNVIFVMCGATFIIGSIGLYLQYNIRKFLAYSTITHSGYIVLSLFTGTFSGWYGAVLYLVTYLLSMCLLLFFGAFTYNNQNRRSVISFLELAGIQKRRPALSPVILCLFSLIGLPPLAGFWVKLYVIENIVSHNTVCAWLLLLVIICTSILNAVGYLRVIKIFYVQATNNASGSNPIALYSKNYLIIVNAIAAFLLAFIFILAKYSFSEFSELYMVLRITV